MAPKFHHRDISLPLQVMRNALLGRKLNEPNRFPDEMSPRPGPKPNIPEGPASAIAANPYNARDARRAYLPPVDVANGQKLLTDAKEASKPKRSWPPKLDGIGSLGAAIH